MLVSSKHLNSLKSDAENTNSKAYSIDLNSTSLRAPAKVKQGGCFGVLTGMLSFSTHNHVQENKLWKLGLRSPNAINEPF